MVLKITLNIEVGIIILQKLFIDNQKFFYDKYIFY